jgi:diaminohydroxyphosphoribosylaminopyrimidine deaminase/5-amino-6-(5-phosphoribosylamino)uracil reductase
MNSPQSDRFFMQRALELAQQGQGRVEPNPMVGCVVVRDGCLLGEGWHRFYGGPHAEIEAIRSAKESVAGATLYTTLEPCSHHGKTPPCSRALMEASIGRVVVALRDPHPQVAGGGISALQQAGIRVDVGVLEDEARRLCAPYLQLIQTGRPWVIAKWAMSLDGKIATASGESRWISSPAARSIVHRLRGRMDAIVVGRRTAALDDPQLTAAPPGPRVATRIVMDSHASLSLTSRLVQTAGQAPVVVAAAEDAPAARCHALQETGVEVILCRGNNYQERLAFLLRTLGERRMTNVLVEGGGKLLGTLFDGHSIDEVHVFLASKLIAGEPSISPIGGKGVSSLGESLTVEPCEVEWLGTDAYLHGLVRR